MWCYCAPAVVGLSINLMCMKKKAETFFRGCINTLFVCCRFHKKITVLDFLVYCKLNTFTNNIKNLKIIVAKHEIICKT